MENLQTYLAKTGTTQAALAAEVGISRGHMSEIASGEKTPSLPVAARIEQVTGGLVKAISLIAPHSRRSPDPRQSSVGGGV
jgi:transcriptional regulator with XRE-family HTH domain